MGRRDPRRAGRDRHGHGTRHRLGQRRDRRRVGGGAWELSGFNGSAHIVTDEHLGYQGIGKHFARHRTVDHSQTYVRALIFHTNFAESYHSLLKRGIVGTFHHVSKKHLSRYLREFEFRWNTRKDDDGDRTFKAIKQARGKRLMYRQPA
ncbi:MAG: IS1595 family transposase [Thalassobaculum sp.]